MLDAATFLPAAEAAGLMPTIDNLMLFRCVQVIRRLMTRNRDVGLFCNVSAATLADAVRNRREELMEGFPEAALTRTLEKTWHSSATAVYRNWLSYVMSNKSDMRGFSAVTAPLEIVERKRSALR